MRPRKPDRRLHDQVRRQRAVIAHMRSEIEMAWRCLDGIMDTEQGPNQAARHIRSALDGTATVPTRGATVRAVDDEILF